jgi:hypothetical protein
VADLLGRAAIQMEANQSPLELVSGARLEEELWGLSKRQVDRFLRELTDGETEGEVSRWSAGWAGLARLVGLRAVLFLGLGAVIGAVVGPAVTATLLVLVVVVVQPLYGRSRFRRFVRLVRRQPSARVRYYVGGIAGSWIYVGTVAVIGALAGRDPRSIGLTVHAKSSYEATQSTSAIVAATITLVASIAVLWAANPTLAARIRRMILAIAELLPQTTGERIVFAGVSVTAGICEEILYRGFGVAYLRWLDPNISPGAIVAVTATFFGLAHLYQGPKNVLLTGFVGVLLASITVSTGTLLPAIVIHTLVDLRVSFLPAKIANPQGDYPTGPPARSPISNSPSVK